LNYRVQSTLGEGIRGALLYERAVNDGREGECARKAGEDDVNLRRSNKTLQVMKFVLMSANVTL
jgi:hypothetical protein